MFNVLPTTGCAIWRGAGPRSQPPRIQPRICPQHQLSPPTLHLCLSPPIPPVPSPLAWTCPHSGPLPTTTDPVLVSLHAATNTNTNITTAPTTSDVKLPYACPICPKPCPHSDGTCLRCINSPCLRSGSTERCMLYKAYLSAHYVGPPSPVGRYWRPM